MNRRSLVGATIRATNRTHGLAPARPAGDPETVEVADPFDNTIYTKEGNLYFSGDYTIVRYAEEEYIETPA